MQIDEALWFLWLCVTDFPGMLSWHWPAVLCVLQLLRSLYFAYINRNLQCALADSVVSKSASWQLLGTSVVLGMYCIVPIVLWFFDEWGYIGMMLCFWPLHSFLIFSFAGVFAAHLMCVQWEMGVYAYCLKHIWWPDRDQTKKEERFQKVFKLLRDNRPPQQVRWIDYLELLTAYANCFDSIKQWEKKIDEKKRRPETTGSSVEDLENKINKVHGARTTAHTFPFVWRSAVFGRVSLVLVLSLACCVYWFGRWLSVPSEKDVNVQIKAQNLARMKEVVRAFK